MRDLEIKGTGNSRYIKSSVPASTTFDEFLTMLRAGNLPIDLMGLNTAGIITQSPSAYNKANVLPEDVCELMSLDATTSEPDDAFRYLALMQASVYGKIVITVTSNGLPLSGVTFTLGSNTLTTDANGKASVILPPGGYTANFTSTLDLTFSPSSFAVTSTKGKINYYTVQATEVSNNQKTFTSSQTFRFSERVKSFDVFCVGGGGSGGAATMIYDLNSRGAVAATGGASGFTKTLLNQTYTSGKSITVTIGAGGAAVTASNTVSTSIGSGSISGGQSVKDTDGKDGGATSVSYNGSIICTANGGHGGTAYSSTLNTQFGMFWGSAGGNGSAGAGGDAEGSSGNWSQYVWIKSTCGRNGTVQPTYTNVDGELKTATDLSQGYTNKAFEESLGEAYGIPGQSCAASRNNGSFTGYSSGTSTDAELSVYTNGTLSVSAQASNGSGYGDGGGAAGALSRTNSTSNRTYNISSKSGSGKSGCVIIRWRYS